MNNITMLVFGLLGLLVSLHAVRRAGTALGIPPQLLLVAVRALLSAWRAPSDGR